MRNFFSVPRIAAILILNFFLVQGACSSSSNSPPPPESPVLFESIGVNVILPTYDDLVAETALLLDATQSLCASPSADLLAEAQEAWRRVRAPLKKSEAFLFGPVKDLGIQEDIDFWPTRPNNIEEAIAGVEPFDDAFVENLGTSAKGIPAIEYLLFDPEGGDAAILSLLTDPMAGARRCEYLVALAANARSQAQLVRNAWVIEGGVFLQNLIEAGDNKIYPTVSAATSDFVNSMVFLSEAVQGTKIGGPLGKKSGGDPDPSALESFYSDNSLDDIIYNLEGLQNIYHSRYGSRDGVGFDDSIRSKDPVLADEIARQIEVCLEVVRAIPPPLKTAVSAHTALVEWAYEEARKLQVLLEGQFAGVLGATVTFSDNDGD